MALGQISNLTENEKREIINDIILFFDNERGEAIGEIAANQVLELFLESVAPKIHNRAINQAKKVIESRIDELNYDLDDLIKS